MKLRPLALILSMPILFALGCATTKINRASTLEQNNGKYLIHVQNQILEIDPSKGGRINSLMLDGIDFLTDSNVNNFNWGSTFWFSPQSDWKWPPSAEIDSMPYSVKIHSGRIIMQSLQDPRTGLDVLKEFSGDPQRKSFLLKYTITNRRDKAQKVAPWEVTRVQTDGLAFFPYGKGERRGGLIPFTKEIDGISWFQYNKERLPVKGDRQLYSDGSEGWLAEINDGIILIKKFEDIPYEKNAPKEGEIEWYASPVVEGKSYVEIEHQGAYEEIYPGQSANWQVEWFLRKLPENIKAEVGNPALVEYVRNIVR